MIIDFHCHFGRSFFRYREYKMEAGRLQEEMKAHGVERAVLCAAGELAAYYNQDGNDQVGEAVRQHPGQFYGFAVINPWMRQKAVEEVRRSYEKWGFPGIVLHPLIHGIEANDPLVLPVVEAALRLKMIVYITGGTPILAMPYKIADVAGRYPEGRFILGHGGWDFHFDAIDCLRACPNLLSETSKNHFPNLETTLRVFGPGRLLFGSDYPFSSYRAEIEKVRLLPEISEEGRQQIFGGNAAALLH